jgi:peptide/nickel transport system substrate-binding protein
MLTRRQMLGAAASGMCLGALPGRQAFAQKQGGTLVLAFQTDIAVFNNIADSQFGAHMVSSNLFNMLVSLDTDLKPQPELAESWMFSDGGRTVAFRLRKGVHFHDGAPLTSADVKFTIEKAMPHHPRAKAFWLPIVEAVETPDELTAVIRMREPFAPLLSFLGVPTGGCMILPKHVFEPYVGSREAFLKAPPTVSMPVGSGPFVFQEYVRGSHVSLVRNPNYWNAPKPYADRLVIRFISDENSRMVALEKGEIDFINSNIIPWDQVPRLRKDPRFKVLDVGEEGTAQLEYLVINGFRPTTGNPKVRQALAFAIDRAQIAALAAAGLANVANGIVHSKTGWAYSPVYEHYKPNPARARVLLDEAGFPMKGSSRFSLSLSYATGIAPEAAAAEIIKQQLKPIGIDVNLSSYDRASAMGRVYIDRNYDLFLQAIVSGPDPKMAVAPLYDANNRVPGVFTNSGNYENARVQEILRGEGAEQDVTKRGDMWKEIGRLVAQDVPLLPLYELPCVHTQSAPAETSLFSRAAQVDSVDRSEDGDVRDHRGERAATSQCAAWLLIPPTVWACRRPLRN